MRNVSFGKGMARAMILAGPIFVTLFWAAGLQGGRAIEIDAGLAYALPVLLLAAFFGAILAFLPVVIGTAALAAVGRANVGVRHPAFWAIIGGAAVGAFLAAVGSAADGPDGVALIGTGVACALLCRSGVVWDD